MIGPYEYTSEGREVTAWFIEPTGPCFLVPGSHVKEFMDLRTEHCTVIKGYIYPEHKPMEKWKYFVVGIFVGLLPYSIIKLIALL